MGLGLLDNAPALDTVLLGERRFSVLWRSRAPFAYHNGLSIIRIEGLVFALQGYRYSQPTIRPYHDACGEPDPTATYCGNCHTSPTFGGVPIPPAPGAYGGVNLPVDSSEALDLLVQTLGRTELSWAELLRELREHEALAVAGQQAKVNDCGPLVSLIPGSGKPDGGVEFHYVIHKVGHSGHYRGTLDPTGAFLWDGVTGEAKGQLGPEGIEWANGFTNPFGMPRRLGQQVDAHLTLQLMAVDSLAREKGHFPPALKPRAGSVASS